MKFVNFLDLKKLKTKFFSKEYLKINLGQLTNLNLHLGHDIACWDANFGTNVYAKRSNLLIINLDKTFFSLRRSLFIINNIIKKGGCLFLIHEHTSKNSYLKILFQNLGQLFFFTKWVYGLIDNYTYFIKYASKIRNDKYSVLNTTARFEGLDFFKKLPSVTFILEGAKHEKVGAECARVGLPSIAIQDTNSNFHSFTYPVPGNDDSILGHFYIYLLLRNSILLGKYQFFKKIYLNNFFNLEYHQFLKLMKSKYSKRQRVLQYCYNFLLKKKRFKRHNLFLTNTNSKFINKKRKLKYFNA